MLLRGRFLGLLFFKEIYGVFLKLYDQNFFEFLYALFRLLVIFFYSFSQVLYLFFISFL